MVERALRVPPSHGGEYSDQTERKVIPFRGAYAANLGGVVINALDWTGASNWDELQNYWPGITFNPNEDFVMADLTREEIDAKLAAVEARSETRFTELSGKVDRVADSVAVLSANIASLATNVSGNVSNLQAELREVKADSKSSRNTIIATIVASVLAAVGIIYFTQANLLAAFSAGLALHSEASPAPPPKTAPSTHQ